MCQVGNPAPTFQPLALGGGGLVSGIDVNSDGTIAIRTDTCGAFVGNIASGTKWRQVVNISSMPSGIVGFDIRGNYHPPVGCYEIKIAPSNSSIWYMTYNGAVYRSTNKGQTWAQTALTRLTWSGNENDAYRQNSSKMAIDPNDPNTVLVGTPANGLYYTTNGGASWTSIGAVPISGTMSGAYPGVTGICFDPTSGTTNGRTNTAYAASYGNGVYQTTGTVAGTWSIISNSPTVVTAAVMQGGTYLCCGGNTPTLPRDLYSYLGSGSTWTTLLTQSNGINTVAVDPKDSSRIVVCDQTRLNQYVSGSWTGKYNTYGLNSDADIPWFNRVIPTSGSNPVFLTISNIFFDPSTPNKIWCPMGIGVLYTTFTPSQSLSSTVAYTSQTAGIENLVGRTAISAPGRGAYPIISVEDRQEFVITNPSSYPATYGIVDQGSSTLYAGWSIDFAKDSSGMIVALNNSYNSFGAQLSGYSENYGRSWSQFAAQLPTAIYPGGCIAASTSQNFVQWLYGQAQVNYTTDGGSSWSRGSGLPASSAWPGSFFDFTQILCADGVLPNTFYAFHFSHGIYVSTNSGSTWSNQGPSPLSGENFQPTMISVPGQASYLLLTQGQIRGSHPNTNPLYFSSNGGVSWSSIGNCKDIWAVGIGAANGGSYPTIWIAGFVKISGNYKYGIAVCKNFNPSGPSRATWTWLIDWPYGNLDQVISICGDGNDHTKCYMTFGGSGAGYGSNLVY